MIGLADAQVLEEDLVEREVVVLPRVDQDVLDRRIEAGDHPREPDQLGPRADDRHDLEHQRPSRLIVWGLIVRPPRGTCPALSDRTTRASRTAWSARRSRC